MERAAHARAVATAKGRRIGRPLLIDHAKLGYAAHLRDSGDTIAEIVAKTGIARSSLYRHLPPRPAPTVTAAAGDPAGRRPDRTSCETPRPCPGTCRPTCRLVPLSLTAPLYGGSVETGRLPAGGYRVRARLPIEPVAR